MSNTIITNEGLNLAHEASSEGVFLYIKYFLPIYDHRMDPNVHDISNLNRNSVSSFDQLHSVDNTEANIFGEKLWNITSIPASQYTISTSNRLLIYNNAIYKASSYVDYIDIAATSADNQQFVQKVNLLNGVSLTNTVSGSVFNGIQNVSNGSVEQWQIQNSLLITGNNSVPGTLTDHTKYYQIQSYTPLTSGSTTVKGVYKCQLDNSVGNFKFNKIGLYAVKVDSNYNIITTAAPKLFAIAALTSPIIKSKVGTEIANFECDVELQLQSTDLSLSNIIFYAGSDWNRTPDVSNVAATVGTPSLHWDGYVGIRTYLNHNIGPQVPLHVIDDDTLFRLEAKTLIFAASRYVDFKVEGDFDYSYLRISEHVTPYIDATRSVGKSLGTLTHRWKSVHTESSVSVGNYQAFMLNSDDPNAEAIHSFQTNSQIIGFNTRNESVTYKRAVNPLFADGDLSNVNSPLIVRTEAGSLDDSSYTASLYLLAGVSTSPDENGYYKQNYRTRQGIIDLINSQSYSSLFSVGSEGSNAAASIVMGSPGPIELITHNYGYFKFTKYLPDEAKIISWVLDITNISNDNVTLFYPTGYTTREQRVLSIASNIIPEQSTVNTYNIGSNEYPWSTIISTSVGTNNLYSLADNITIGGNLLSEYDLGGSSLYWGTAYIRNISIGKIYPDNGANNITVYGNLNPPSNNIYDLGYLNVAWRRLYCTTINAGTVYAASRLSTPLIQADQIALGNSPDNYIGEWKFADVGTSNSNAFLEIGRINGDILEVVTINTGTVNYMVFGNTLFISAYIQFRPGTGSQIYLDTTKFSLVINNYRLKKRNPNGATADPNTSLAPCLQGTVRFSTIGALEYQIFPLEIVAKINNTVPNNQHDFTLQKNDAVNSGWNSASSYDLHITGCYEIDNDQS